MGTEEIAKLLKEIQVQQIKDSERTKRMERKLLGDKEYGVKGMIEQVNEHEQHIQSQRLEKAKLIGFSTGAGLAGGGVFAWIKHLFGG
jgi:uncharacterized protein YdaL